MIVGLQVDVKSEELVTILEERKRHHESKKAAYESQAAELTRVIKNIEEDMQTGKVSSGMTPAGSMEQKAREHGEKAQYYKFMIEHVVQNDVYRLGQDDLARLGIVARMF